MQRYKYFFNYQNKYFYFKFIFAGCFAIYGKQYIFVVPHQPNIALGYCVKFPRCILIYDAGGLFISYSDNTTICTPPVASLVHVCTIHQNIGALQSYIGATRRLPIDPLPGRFPLGNVRRLCSFLCFHI